MTPDDLIRPEIRALSAYHVPDATGLVKLDAMENPYELPEPLAAEWAERVRSVAMNRYPDPGASALKAVLREAMEIPERQAILLGNGSDEIIQMILMAVAGPDRVVLAPEPAFVMYRMIAVFCGMRYVGVPLSPDDFALDPGAMLASIAEHRPAAVFLAYPNNPTGNLFDREVVEAIIEATPGLVVLDEAYAPFADDSFMRDLGRHDNLLVMRTVSKMGLAGLRLGYLCGAPAWLDEFEKIRLPYNIGVLTQAAARFALEHKPVFDEQAARIRAERERLLEGLRALPGIHAWDSAANFILFRTSQGRAAAVFEGLKGRGVLIKNLTGAGGMLTDCLRVTVGTPQENGCFLDALRATMARDAR